MGAMFRFKILSLIAARCGRAYHLGSTCCFTVLSVSIAAAAPSEGNSLALQCKGDGMGTNYQGPVILGTGPLIGVHMDFVVDFAGNTLTAVDSGFQQSCKITAAEIACKHDVVDKGVDKFSKQYSRVLSFRDDISRITGRWTHIAEDTTFRGHEDFTAKTQVSRQMLKIFGSCKTIPPPKQS